MSGTRRNFIESAGVLAAAANVEFRFDCQQQAYVISDVKLGGI